MSFLSFILNVCYMNELAQICSNLLFVCVEINSCYMFFRMVLYCNKLLTSFQTSASVQVSSELLLAFCGNYCDQDSIFFAFSYPCDDSDSCERNEWEKRSFYSFHLQVRQFNIQIRRPTK